ncbi:MAG: RNA polymerase sigma factor (sigma-70 family) [Cellvibrionaceae bacterium]|jgi:RNA polymerase sigma factor (sigma-70 family)
MLNTNNDCTNELNFNEHAGTLGIDARSYSLGSGRVSSPNETHHSDDLVADAIDYTRIKLTSFRLLSSLEERNLALKLASTSQTIALIILTWEQSARELMKLLVTATTNGLNKNQFAIGEHYFAFRSELAHFVNADDNATSVPLLVKALQAEMPSIESGGELSSNLIKSISIVDWPGPLMLALAARHGSKGTPASNLEQAINKYLSTHDQPDKGRLPADEHRAQLDYHAKTYLDARETLVKHNLRLVFHVAKRYTQRSDQLVDLIQEGTFGLMRAAEKFRSAVGYRFSTYAYQWIESKIRLARVNIDRVITISPEYNNDLIRLSQWMGRQKSTSEHGSLQDLLQDLNINKERLDSLMRIKQYSLSLEENGTNEGLSLHTKIADPDANFVETIFNERHADHFSSIMNSVLTERECYIVNERFGRLNSDFKTLQELSNILGISRERVRQLEGSALEKLRNWISGHDLLLNIP